MSKGFGPRRRQAGGGGRSDWAALAEYGVSYPDAMKMAADVRRDLLGRLATVDRFLALSEAEYRAAAADRSDRPAVAALCEIRGWADGELALASRAFGLDPAAVGELAAIRECDGGYPRRQAAIMALREFLQRCGRYDARAKALVDDGAVLDLARRFLDQREMRRLAAKENPA